MDRSLRTALFSGLALLAACGGEDPNVEPARVGEVSVRIEPVDSLHRLTAGDTLHLSQATRDFYAARNGAPAWLDGDELGERGRALLDALARAEEDGLSPERYRYEVARTLAARVGRDESRADSAVGRQLADLELLLTEGSTRFARDLVAGTLDPEEAGVEWRIPRGEAELEPVLTRMAGGEDPSIVFAELRPSVPHYDRMRKALARHLEVARQGGWPQVPASDRLRPGERDSAVAVLRRRLIAGVDAEEVRLAGRGAADPTRFDPDLEAAVKRFQDRHAIEADGIPGEATLRELNHTVDERIAELKLNLDRWRWLPEEIGERFVVVNVAGFELEVVDGGRVVEAMNVVVGQPSWSTPVFADTMENVVVNPYWNVPESIYEDELKAKFAADPGYASRNGFEWVDGRVRQRPGDDNALGRLKFLFPNDDDIYLHDTPAGHLFSRTRRDFSHGCIRLERPEDLARLVLRMQTDLDPSVLDTYLARGSEKWITLDRPLPVYILYFTAWAQEDGTIRFHHDIYGRDEQFEDQTRDRLERPARVAANSSEG